MKNGNENFFPYNQKSNKCSICNSEKISINTEKLKNNKLKIILSKIEKEDLINKCKCSNEEKKAHKICLLLNVIFNFEIKCRQCKSDYNISITKKINNSKKLCKIFSYLFLTLFHIIIFAASVILILYVIVINKDIKDNFEKKHYFHIPIFFGVFLLVLNIILIPITYFNFIDKSEKDVYDYMINICDESQQNKIKNDSDQFYYLLYEFYKYFYGTRLRYLITKKHKSLFFSSGYGNFNKEIKKMIKENNELTNDIINLNENNKKDSNVFHYTGTLGDFDKKNMENKNIQENISNDKNSKNTNPINLQLSLIKKEYLEDNKSHKENMDDIFIINNNLKSGRKGKKSERNAFNSISIYSNKKFNLISKSCFYKKIESNKLFLKSRTYKTKSDRKKDKKENSIKLELNKNSKKAIKIKDSDSEKNYVDSTFYLKKENNKDKEKQKNS